jgi:Restriction endonuclease S subunits
VGAFLQTKFDYLREHCTGATIPHINRKSLEDIEIPLPHVSIQKKIADTLNKILTLIEKRKEQIAVLDEAVKSWYMYNLGPQASSYSDWKGISIKEIAADKKNSMRTGPFGSNLLHSEFVDSGIAVLGIDNAVNNKFEWKERRYITKEKYEKLRSYTVFPRDVIITIMGTTGRSAVIPVDIPLSINTKHLACITLDKEKANPYFISYSIHSHPYLLQQIKNRNKGAIMDGLNLTIIKNLQIPLPPLELQNKFEDIIIEAEQKKELLNKSLAELEITHKSTIQKAFNGELF